MAHTIEFIQFDENFEGLLSREQAVAFIDLLFEGPDSRFVVYGNETKKDWRGSCTPGIGYYRITLSRKTIEEHHEKGYSMGGNLPHDDIRVATGSVLAHEIRHANQHVKHGTNSKFWSGKYYVRPCEVDARLYADKVEDIIRSVFNLDQKRWYREDEAVKLRTLMGMVREMDEVSAQEVAEMLGCIGMNNPVYRSQVVRELRDAGVDII